MKSPVTSCIAVFTAWLVMGLAHANDANVPIDQLPMYGGMDRNAVPMLRASDEYFLSSVTEAFGSREAAGQVWIELGFKFYGSNELSMAMRRFNQAWLLDPENPEVYWGFATVLHGWRKMCEALRMVELAKSKGPLQPGFKPDAALIYTDCAQEQDNSSIRAEYWNRSDGLFQSALDIPEVPRKYTLVQWARALFARGEYVGALKKMESCDIEAGEACNSEYVELIKRKILESSTALQNIPAQHPPENITTPPPQTMEQPIDGLVNLTEDRPAPPDGKLARVEIAQLFIFWPAISDFLANDRPTVLINDTPVHTLRMGTATTITMEPGQYTVKLKPRTFDSRKWTRASTTFEAVPGQAYFLAIWPNFTGQPDPYVPLANLIQARVLSRLEVRMEFVKFEDVAPEMSGLYLLEPQVRYIRQGRAETQSESN